MMNTAKYFWDLNSRALKETQNIIKRNHAHPKFIARLITLLSRCDRPKEVFSLINENDFIKVWPKARAYWRKIQPESDFRDWWETIYEELFRRRKIRTKNVKGRPSALFVRVGKMIARSRIQNGLSQKDLALRAGMSQPDISKIEEGRQNITLETLACLCKVLNIKKIELEAEGTVYQHVKGT